MPLSALEFPHLDPTPIFDAFRGNFSTELLAAAVIRFRLFDRLKHGPKSFAVLRNECALSERAAVVLFTAMRAMQLVETNSRGELELTPLSREHLVGGAPFDVSDYIELGADSPGVKEMVQRLRTDTPAGAY